MKIISQLENYIPTSKNYMSSYGLKHLYNSDYHNITNLMNSGAFEYLTLYKKIKSIFYNILINKIFGRDINNNFFIKSYRELSKKQNRIFNLDLIYHSIVLEILKDHNLLREKICTIGDGKANFIIGAKLNYPNSRIFSINLPLLTW